MSENRVKWHPYPEEKPKNNSVEPYLVSVRCFEEIIVDMEYYEDDSFKWFPYGEDKRVVAWAELPDPYEEVKG